MNIRDVLNTVLSDEDRQFLQIAFEDGNSLLHEFQPGRFIGVNVEEHEDYEVIERKGKWTLLKSKHGKPKST